jgi:hypothetical protein
MGDALCLVAHTWTNREGAEYIRIISARKATKLYRKIYEEDAYALDSHISVKGSSYVLETKLRDQSPGKHKRA